MYSTRLRFREKSKLKIACRKRETRKLKRNDVLLSTQWKRGWAESVGQMNHLLRDGQKLNTKFCFNFILSHRQGSKLQESRILLTNNVSYYCENLIKKLIHSRPVLSNRSCGKRPVSDQGIKWLSLKIESPSISPCRTQNTILKYTRE